MRGCTLAIDSPVTSFNTPHYPVKRCHERVDLFFFSNILLIAIFMPLVKR